MLLLLSVFEVLQICLNCLIQCGDALRRNQANFDRSGMTLLICTARFTGTRALEVPLRNGGTREVTADNIFLNTGTRPAMPLLPSLVEARPLNSESVQELDRLPEHLIVLGGGYIGCEIAHVFRRFGCRVTILERSEAFLPRGDPDPSYEVELDVFRKTKR